MIADDRPTRRSQDRPWPIPACCPRSGRSATPMTPPWPRASPTASRPSWSPTASGPASPSSAYRQGTNKLPLRGTGPAHTMPNVCSARPVPGLRTGGDDQQTHFSSPKPEVQPATNALFSRFRRLVHVGKRRGLVRGCEALEHSHGGAAPGAEVSAGVFDEYLASPEVASDLLL